MTGATAEHSLLEFQVKDAFVLFSSITSIMGNMAQSNYSAANGYMDAFARWLAPGD